MIYFVLLDLLQEYATSRTASDFQEGIQATIIQKK